jgi:hypothetical protein
MAQNSSPMPRKKSMPSKPQEYAGLNVSKSALRELSEEEIELENAIGSMRRQLKLDLLQRRTIKPMPGPICPISGEFVPTACDMHEVFLTRGDVMKASEEVRVKIYVKENCVLVHHGKCHEQAATQIGKARCVQSLLWFEGYADILAWLIRMHDLLRSDQAVQEINSLNGVMAGFMSFNIEKPMRIWRF